MTDNQAFEAWLKGLVKFPLPRNKMARVRILAKELAYGFASEWWDELFAVEALVPDEVLRGYFSDEQLQRITTEDLTARIPDGDLLRHYFRVRWGAPDFSRFREFDLLQHLNFVQEARQWSAGTSDVYEIGGASLALLDEVEPSNVFISYKRSESSAFALLVLARLKEIGLQPFVDMAIEPGANWLDYLRERIDASEYVVVLIGHKTLESQTTQQELLWAKQMGKVILPIWHNGFQYRTGDWKLVPELDRMLQDTHTIIVQNESAAGYHAALTELVNRFGYTP